MFMSTKGTIKGSLKLVGGSGYMAIRKLCSDAPSKLSSEAEYGLLGMGGLRR